MKSIVGLVVLSLVMVFGVSPAVFAKPPSVTGLLKSVCIDPGHGGSDSGAVYGGIEEEDLNLDVANALTNELTSRGYKVYLTRTDDSTKSNNDRYTFCNSTDATTLVSVHHNASTDSNIDYTLAMYHQSASKPLADYVGRSVANALGQASTFRTARFPSGVLIKSNMPSVMSEGYFLSNAGRLAQLQANYASMVTLESQAIANGLDSYYAR
jgi:N-acetylmuramoyl-L-alanine amidase